MADITQGKSAWEENTLRKVVARFPERRESFETTSGTAWNASTHPMTSGETTSAT